MVSSKFISDDLKLNTRKNFDIGIRDGIYEKLELY
jgi:hypothetical protein